VGRKTLTQTNELQWYTFSSHIKVYCLTVGRCLTQLGNDAIWRENEDGAKKAILIVDPTQQVTGDGFVVGWNVYTTRGRRSQTVHLQIWRPVNAANHRCCNSTGILVSSASFQYCKDNVGYVVQR